jgi:hypothetical protein
MSSDNEYGALVLLLRFFSFFNKNINVIYGVRINYFFAKINKYNANFCDKCCKMYT